MLNDTYTGEIYIHTCTITGKSYIGQTINGMENRWKRHVSDARRNTDNYKFYNAIRKYGADVWTHGILVQTKSQAESDSEEIRYIDEYDTFQNGYNGTEGGGGSSGSKHTAETKAKLSAINTGKKHTAESLEKMSGKKNHRYDHTVRTIEKPDATGDETKKFTGTTQEMLAAIPELTQSGLSLLLSRDQKTHKGWRLLDFSV
jgi:group I intron endonuclease